MNKIENKKNGFTLVEVLVASTILAIGLLATATMISRSTIADSRAYYITKASMMIEEYIENATHAQYDSAQFASMTDNSRSINIDGVIYNVDCIITNNSPLNNNTKEVTCTASWNNKGIQASTTYEYVFSRKF